MKTFSIILVVLLLPFIVESKNFSICSDSIKVHLLGEWHYKATLTEETNEEVRIVHRDRFAFQRIIFEQCNDKKEITRFPDIVKKMRDRNFLKNVRLKTFDYNGNFLDIIYPVAFYSKDSSFLDISAYGLKSKDYWDILYLKNDSMAISGGLSGFFKGRQVWVKHVYYKKVQQVKPKLMHSN